MKKLLLLMLVLMGGVTTASAWYDCMYLRCEAGGWDNAKSEYKFTQMNPTSGASNEYYYRLDGSNIREGDFYFRISYDDAGNNEHYQWQPGTDGQEITTTKYVTNDQGSSRAFCIKQDPKAVKVDIFIKWENDKWSITALVMYNYTIHWKNDYNWNPVKAYTWDGVGDHRTIYELGAIDDVAELSKNGDFYSVSFLGSSTVKAMFFENKDGAHKTNNLNVVNNGVYKVWNSADPSGIKVNITDVGYATFSSTKAVDFTDESTIEACKASVDEKGNITYTPVTTVAANEGVLLRRADKKISSAEAVIPLNADQTISANSGNQFIGITTKQKIAQSTESGYTNFVLSKVNNELAFYKVNTNGSWCGAGTAYLKVANGSIPSSREFFALDNETTGINALDNLTDSQLDNAPMYNLAGQRVGKNYKGVVIVNGKKMILK